MKSYPKSGVRDASGDIRHYDRERAYESRPEQVRNRVIRNKARAAAMKKGLVHKGDTKEVDHIRPLAKGGSSKASNTRVTSRSFNRKRAAKARD